MKNIIWSVIIGVGLYHSIYSNNVYAQTQVVNESKRLEIINKTDSLIRLYNSYHPCVVDVGHFSDAVATLFVELFSPDAILIDDLSRHIPTRGLYPKDYIAALKARFPTGLAIANFTVLERKISRKPDGSAYEVELKGEKSITGLDNQNQVYHSLFDDFIIKLAVDSTVNNINITGTSTSGHILRDYYTLTALVVDQDKAAIEGAVVRLSVDGKLIETKFSNNRGRVIFTHIEKGSHVSYDARLGDSLMVDKQVSLTFTEASETETILVLKKVIWINRTITLKDLNTREPIAGATIYLTIGGKMQVLKSNIEGVFKYSYAEKETGVIEIKKPGYQSLHYRGFTLRDEVRLSPKNMHSAGLIISPGISIFNVKGDDGPAGYKISPKLSGGYALGYQFVPSRYLNSKTGFGFYGELEMRRIKPEGNIDGIRDIYQGYPDYEKDTFNLVITAKKVFENYDLNTLNIYLGASVKYVISSLAGKDLSVQLGLGPLISMLSGNEVSTKYESIEFSGVYDHYFGTEFQNIPRLGFVTNPLHLNPGKSTFSRVNLGYSASLSAFYSMSRRFDVFAGIQYCQVVTNMLSSDRTLKYADLTYSQNSQSPTGYESQHHYYGILNKYDSFRFSGINVRAGMYFQINY